MCPRLNVDGRVWGQALSWRRTQDPMRGSKPKPNTKHQRYQDGQAVSQPDQVERNG